MLKHIAKGKEHRVVVNVNKSSLHKQAIYPNNYEHCKGSKDCKIAGSQFYETRFKFQVSKFKKQNLKQSNI